MHLSLSVLSIILSVGVSGQIDYNITIIPEPERSLYLVGETLKLMCMVNPSPPTNAAVMYEWECSGCFADGMTTQTISRDLTNMDNNTMIDCVVTVDGGNATMTDTPFELQVIEGT